MFYFVLGIIIFDFYIVFFGLLGFFLSRFLCIFEKSLCVLIIFLFLRVKIIIGLFLIFFVLDLELGVF